MRVGQMVRATDNVLRYDPQLGDHKPTLNATRVQCKNIKLEKSAAARKSLETPMVFVRDGWISNAVSVYGERTRLDGEKQYYKNTRPNRRRAWVGSTDCLHELYSNHFHFKSKTA